MKIYVSHSGNYDYESELYAPLKSSDFAHGYQILFPHDKENIDTNSKSLIANSDLVLAEISHASTGQGIELGLASAANTPILCIYRTGSKISSSLRFVATEFIEYTDANDMLKKLGVWLQAKE